MKWIARSKAEQNRAVVDPWTTVHLAAGLALGLVEAPRAFWIGVATGYELAEQGIERRQWGKAFFRTSGPETLSNALVDLAVLAVGIELGRRWNRTGG